MNLSHSARLARVPVVVAAATLLLGTASASGKPVTDAVIVQTRIDMSPDAMGEMASPLVAVPSNEPGVYSFKTDLDGRPVAPEHRGQGQGEAETVVGKITFSATR